MKLLKYSVLLLALTFGSASAQETDGLMEMSLEDLMNIEVSVASKSKESLSDAPSSVTVLVQKLRIWAYIL